MKKCLLCNLLATLILGILLLGCAGGSGSGSGSPQAPLPAGGGSSSGETPSTPTPTGTETSTPSPTQTTSTPSPTPTLGSFIGVGRCAPCHPDEYATWHATGHGDHYDGAESTWMLSSTLSAYSSSCVPCHVVGYQEPTGYDSLDATAQKKLRTIQCEECHGGGSLHEAAPLDQKKNFIRRVPISQSCRDCHSTNYKTPDQPSGTPAQLSDIFRNDSLSAIPGYPHHPQTQFWQGWFAWQYPNETYTTGAHTTLTNCVFCHLTQGTDKHDLAPDIQACQTCHADLTTFNRNGIQTTVIMLRTLLLQQMKTFATAHNPTLQWDTTDPSTVKSGGGGLWDSKDHRDRFGEAYFNYHYSVSSGCNGIHNPPYDLEILTSSYNDLTNNP